MSAPEEIFDYNIYDDESGYDEWTEYPYDALVLVLAALADRVTPKVVKYPTALTHNGTRYTVTDGEHWELDDRQLVEELYDYAHARGVKHLD